MPSKRRARRRLLLHPGDYGQGGIVNANNAVRAIMLLLLCTLSGMAVRADQLDDIRHNGVLVIGVLGTDAPNSFVDPTTRQYVGYEVDLGNGIARRLVLRGDWASRRATRSWRSPPEFQNCSRGASIFWQRP
jgi:ABC-type amino acid transport substrate-binding protein